MNIQLKAKSLKAMIFVSLFMAGCSTLESAYDSTVNTTKSITAFSMSNVNGMPNITTARLNPICNELLDTKSQENNFSHGLCVGIILGVEDNAHYDKKICTPKNISIKDRLIVVRDYVRVQPARINEAFASLVFDALAQKWPC